MKRYALLLLLLLLTGCGDASPTVLTGQAMGTNYHVVLRGKHPSADVVEREIAQLLEEIESQASQWRPGSWVSRFNASREMKFENVPKHVFAMIVTAEDVNRSSAGVFDITCGPLVELWGFGANPSEAVPTQSQIDEALRRCGSDKLFVDRSAIKVIKGIPDLEIDLSGLAKGYAVDRVAIAIEMMGVENFLVEFGGEVCAKGDGPGGDGWVVEIDAGSSEGGHRSITLRDQSCATSGGSQQNRKLSDGRVVAHLIDPRTGMPLVSARRYATVVCSDSCAVADAFATALVVDPSLELPEYLTSYSPR